MKIVAFVPIKMQSTRLKGKNFLPLNGKPLCYHIFHTLLQSSKIDEVYVYCSDETIQEFIPKKVCFQKRSTSLDKDTTKGIEIYSRFVHEIPADWYVLAHATSPFLKVITVDNALSKVVDAHYDSAFSAQKIQTFCWYKNKPLNYSLEDVPRTQNIEPIYAETSGFYIFSKKLIEQGRRIGYQPWIELVNHIEGIDIDEKEDYEFSRSIVNDFKET